MSATQLKTQAIADNAISTPKIGDGQITQPKLASGVGGNTDHSFRLKQGPQAISHNVFTAILWPEEEFDTDNLHDIAVNNDRVTITAATAGKWLLSLLLMWPDSPDVGERMIRILKNGANVDTALQRPYTGNHGMPLVTIIPLAAGDFVSVEVFQQSGVTLTVVSVPKGRSTFSGIRIAT